MNKAIVLSILIIGSLAKSSDFPPFDIFHAHCQISAIYAGRQCTDTFTRMSSIVQGFEGEDPAKGKYSLIEQNINDYIWAERISSSKWVDDVIFQLTQTPAGCQVVGKARAQYFYFKNDGTTYCDIWNVLKYTDVFSNLSTKSCRIVKTNPSVNCVAY
ncbi:UNKNOWN [Stylonychia lemnae]|uniref:Uncharacterized protein n=1 Tax=Stylonychia lemnae TaxID=5949 RepID=A0A077ZP61_STYLE|nr:UNKNOWN [Stylonychia lemnae]|eukprot:CDW71698.1 UNKNOWN [Stylonychia lemnae]